MLSANRFFVRMSTAAFLLATIAVFGIRMRAQDAPAVHVGDATVTGLPDDWTHHHVFFTDPGTEQDAVRNGTHEKWVKTVNDPRYVIQQLKRNQSVQGPASQDVEMRQKINAQRNGLPDRWVGPRRRFGDGPTNPSSPITASAAPLERDWSMNVGGTTSSLTTLSVAAPGVGNISGTSTLTFNVGSAVTLNASAPTAASEAGTFTGNANTGDQLTIGGTEILTAADSTAGTQLGTFNSPPTTASAITVGYGANTLTMKTNGTASSVVGTAVAAAAANTTISVTSGANTLTLTNGGTPTSVTGTVTGSPWSATVPTITIANGATGNTLTLTTNATGANATGTFSGSNGAAGPSVGQTITIQESQYGNTLTLTGGAAGTGTITVNGTFLANAGSLAIGGKTYTFPITGSCGSTANCINTPIGASNANVAKNIAAGLTANSALCGTSVPCYSTGTTAVANIAVSVTTNVVTVTNYTGASMAWLDAFSFGTPLVLSPASGGSIVAGASNSCTSASTGTFVVNPSTPAAAAASVNTAINACVSAFSQVGVLSTVVSNVITVSDTVTGTYSTLTPGGTAVGPGFSWSGVTAGTLGSNGCPIVSTAGTFATGSSAATATNDIALNLATAITNCASSFANVGLGAVSSGNTLTVTNPVPGPYLSASGTGLLGILSWAGVSGGAIGVSTCGGSSTDGTYATSNTALGLANSISTAINTCQAGNPAVGVNASTNGAQVKAAALLPGTSASITASATNNAGIFNWAAPTAGTNGSPSCTATTGTFATDDTYTANVATNFAYALSLCPASTGIASAVAGGSGVTVTAAKWGANPNINLGSNSGVFTWSGAGFTGGTDGANTGLSFAIDNVVADNAANLAAAIVRNGGAPVGVTSTSNASGQVTITASAAGTGGNSITTANNLSNFSLASGTLAGGLDGTADSTHFPYWSVNAYVSQAQLATNIATAVAANPTSNAAITATPNSPSTGNITLTVNGDGTYGNSYTVAAANFTAVSGTGTFTGGAAGGKAGQSPAKYSYSTNTTVTAANCTSDYVVYPTATVGSATQATIVAYNNMYKGSPTPTCSGNVPSIFWAYNTGGRTTLSPVLSLDGNQVAYIQDSGTGTAASLVLLTMANSGSAVVAPTPVAAASYHGCTAPCYTTLPLSGSGADSNSAPWWDYAHDVIYVGDNSGKLHKFNNVFVAGTPAEAAAGGFPATVTATATLKVLTSPVVDGNTGNIYIGEGYTSGNNPYLMQVNSTTGAVLQSHVGAGSTGLGTAPLDAPIVDQSAGRVYAFIGSDGSLSCGTLQVCSAVYQFTEGTTFNTGTPARARVGTGVAGSVEFAGTFDNTYFSSANPASPTGRLYVCGNTNGAPNLYSIAITANAMATGNITSLGALTSGTATCSPISEVYNATSDLIFLSVTTLGNKTGCSGACVYSFNPAISTSVPVAGLTANGGTGTIIIDNTSTAAGASQIYYTTLSSQACGGNGSVGAGTGACAVQASQAALQ